MWPSFHAVLPGSVEASREPRGSLEYLKCSSLNIWHYLEKLKTFLTSIAARSTIRRQGRLCTSSSPSTYTASSISCGFHALKPYCFSGTSSAAHIVLINLGLMRFSRNFPAVSNILRGFCSDANDHGFTTFQLNVGRGTPTMKHALNAPSGKFGLYLNTNFSTPLRIPSASDTFLSVMEKTAVLNGPIRLWRQRLLSLLRVVKDDTL